MNVFIDSAMDEAKRRQELFQGSLFIYSPSPKAVELCEFAREMVEKVFSPFDPREIQKHMPVERCVEILAELKPKFIHHPKCKELIRGLLAERGCDPDKTYFDVPRLRTAFPTDYLSSGIAYAFHPHRDSWYAAPLSQINWWIPVYDFSPENGMAFHPRYWDEKVPNNSDTYNYYRWNRDSRKSAAQHVRADTREQPRPQGDLRPDPQVRLVTRVGGPLLFSAAQLHSTVPNTSGMTRFSIDFRTVHLDDVWNQIGARNVDSASTGTSLRDFIRGSDCSELPENALALYFDGTEAEFVVSPTASTSPS
jgi:hypothetical protein